MALRYAHSPFVFLRLRTGCTRAVLSVCWCIKAWMHWMENKLGAQALLLLLGSCLIMVVMLCQQVVAGGGGE